MTPCKQIRPYTEAVEIMVRWWMARMELTADKIALFRQTAVNILLSMEQEEIARRSFDVDYLPNPVLQTVCAIVGVSIDSLPCKTFTYINSANEVEGRWMRGGEWFRI